MSDIPPPVEDQGPKASEPRVRGSRAGKSARRKRQAWQRWVFSESEGSDLHFDPDAVPFRRPDGTSRAVLRLPAVKPWSQGEEKVIEIQSENEPEEESVGASSSSAAPRLAPTPKVPKATLGRWWHLQSGG